MRDSTKCPVDAAQPGTGHRISEAEYWAQRDEARDEAMAHIYAQKVFHETGVTKATSLAQLERASSRFATRARQILAEMRAEDPPIIDA